MPSESDRIFSAIRNEFWELNLSPGICAAFLSKLDYCQVKVQSQEISCRFKIEEPQAIIENNFLCLPGAGLSVDFRKTANVILREDHLSGDQLELVLTSRDRNEQLTIEIPQLGKKPLSILTKELIKTHGNLPKPATFTEEQRHLCPCCKKRREKTRSRISSHPLYHIISFACLINEEVCLDLHGCMTTCSRTFLPVRECHPEGIISLASGDAVIAIDLGEVFQSIGQLTDFEGEKSTIFQCYNSHGRLLLSLIQQNRKLFEVWSQMTQEVHGK
ncbi:MAG: hypothetical protein VYB61_05120 [Verrucomicrobiota bacterium]|nr:hypothetical protein [Verrucomicrobiota bacterium]